VADGKSLKAKPEKSELSSRSFQTKLATHLTILHLSSLILLTKNTAKYKDADSQGLSVLS